MYVQLIEADEFELNNDETTNTDSFRPDEEEEQQLALTEELLVALGAAGL